MATANVLTNGTPVEVSLANISVPRTIWCRPTNGDTVSIEYTLDDVNWTAWPNGTVSSYSVDTLAAPVSKVRATRASGSGQTSSWGVL